MFEVGFSELLLIMALALIVLGPEKLPKVASQVGRWMGRARAMARQFRETLEEEVQLEETQRRRPSTGGGGTAASTPAPDAAATSAAVAGGLAAAASDPAPAADLGHPGGGYATTSDVDPDTRHNDYAGAAYEPPVAGDTSLDPLASSHAAPPHSWADSVGAPPAADPGVTDGGSPQPADDSHGQRGT
jgi:Tat protein translocase TatB subunit